MYLIYCNLKTDNTEESMISTYNNIKNNYTHETIFSLNKHYGVNNY